MTKRYVALGIGALMGLGWYMESWLIFFLIIGLLIALPPSIDPALRFKQWVEEQRRK